MARTAPERVKPDLREGGWGSGAGKGALWARLATLRIPLECRKQGAFTSLISSLLHFRHAEADRAAQVRTAERFRQAA